MISDDGRRIGEQRRRNRLAAALRENLKRRKAQQRGRARGAGAADRPPGDGAPPDVGRPAEGGEG
jgi:hypothetical protein